MNDDADKPLTWSDALLLGYGPMDDTHREFVGCVQALQRASDAELPAALAAFAAHAERHFGKEDAWMRSTGFPPADCHIDQHAAVLQSVHDVQQALADGADPSLARELTQALVDWFPGHADYLDAALSQWMVKRQHGGAPVVLRRKLNLAERP
jgi:hemerythrin